MSATLTFKLFASFCSIDTRPGLRCACHSPTIILLSSA
ncbi:hypothetical protein BMETH_1652_0 [methanotrophic bacterial endosymbiont of Bathymodiolus sp.]|nr:hypothetical protein BMETH_1652_0 [methanotrophic bacterial endosymbiont of Bathymodiolus sp.]